MGLPDLQRELEQLEAQSLLRRRRRLEGMQGARVRVDGRDYLSFCSNDYLGLAGDPRLIEAACAGALNCGVGAGASHLVSGHHAAHARFERDVAEFAGFDSALLFSSGYAANLGVMSALLGRNDAVFADRLNHASLNDAVLLSRARLRRYPHLDTAALERLLASTPARRKLVATDAVFSMDGDIAPLPQLLALCERHDAWLLVDDAHGFGVLGEAGRGTLSHFGLAAPRIIYMATLGKSAGVAGAFVAASRDLIDWLIARARTYVYTTALPPLLASALATSLPIIAAESWRRERLAERIAALRAQVQVTRWRLAESSTPIQPLLIGASAEAVEVGARLAEHGILVPAIRPPTVPQSTARLRISLSAAHGADDVARLAQALNRIEQGA
ncbi:MAG TPA: 8-amino-7-oxononanoate synthase [Burkholderiales bacterium]|nr:8-amino-7-oxononanoate synthase [Burkholderiales bacterium]